jgi:hypothetical protein
MKTCSQCKTPKPLTAYSTAKCKSGLRARCKACECVVQEAYRQKLKAERRREKETPPQSDSGSLRLPVELAPGDCPCPKKRIDGVLWKAHRADCAALGLFTSAWPRQRGESVTHNGASMGKSKFAGNRMDA